MLFSAAMKSSRHCAFFWKASAGASCSGVAPWALAATMASMRATMAVPPLAIKS